MQKSFIQVEEIDSIDNHTRSEFVREMSRAVASEAGQIQVKTRSGLSIPKLRMTESYSRVFG